MIYYLWQGNQEVRSYSHLLAYTAQTYCCQINSQSMKMRDAVLCKSEDESEEGIKGKRHQAIYDLSRTNSSHTDHNISISDVHIINPDAVKPVKDRRILDKIFEYKTTLFVVRLLNNEIDCFILFYIFA